MTFGDRVSALMNEKKMKQKDIAIKLGITPAVLNRYINNQQTPSVIVAGNIAKVIGVSLDYLVFGNKDEENIGSVGINLRMFEKLTSQNQELIIAVMEAIVAKERLQDLLGES